MNVSKLNPIGYTAKTPDGQEYKKSNIGKTAIIASTIAADIFIGTSKSPLAKACSLESCLKNDLNLNVPKKYMPWLKAASFAMDLLVGIGIGSWIDKKTNEKRLEKLSLNNKQI